VAPAAAPTLHCQECAETLLDLHTFRTQLAVQRENRQGLTVTARTEQL
jgi:hypothetical protein